MTFDSAAIAPALAAERALRLAAGCGNRLLSGSVAEVIEPDWPDASENEDTVDVDVDVDAQADEFAVARALRGALSQMGVRPVDQQRGGARGPADFVFVTGDTGANRIAQLLAARVRGSARLPATLILTGEIPNIEAVMNSLLALGSGEPDSGGPGSRPQALRWRLRSPRAHIIEFRLGNQAVALADPAVSVSASDERSRIAESFGRMEWALRGMPATAALAAELRESGAVRGVRVGVSLVLEPKTAALALALRDAGAEVAVFAPVSETDQAVAAALAETGVVVFAPRRGDRAGDPGGDSTARSAFPATPAASPSRQLDVAHAAAMLDWAPELLIDDGSHLIRLAHTERRAALATLRAASEETTSGVRPLIEMAAEEELRIPVIAVNDARTKSEFDNRVGTGQSCVFAIANLLDTEAANTIRQDPANPTSALNQGFAGVSGSHWVVVGYGPVGVGVARFAAALGARITVVERDAVRALQALHDGHEAGSLDVALPLADVAVSATGVWHTLGADDLALLRPGAAVAVAGGIDDELALDELRARHWRVDEVAPHVATWQAPGANGPPGFIVLADGAGVNYTAGEGNPIEVMDLSFATQLASLARIASGGDGPGVHTLDQAAERRVAQAALTAQGASVDPAPTDARPGGAAQHWTAHRYRSGRERRGVA